MSEKLSHGLNRMTTDLAVQGSALSRGPNLRKKLRTLPITEGEYKDIGILPGATIDLDFSNNIGYVKGFGKGSAMDQIIFTRPSNGSYIGQDGLLKYSTTNPNQILSGAYQRFGDNNVWQKNNVYLGENFPAPNGSLSACLITESSVSSVHQLVTSAAVVTVVGGNTYTYSAYAKAGVGSRFFQIYGNFAVSGSSGGVFDLQNGTATSVNGTGSATASITDVGDGWYRCVVSWVAQSSGVSSAFFSLAQQVTDALNFTYTGDDISSVYVWGVQIEAGASASPFIETNYGLPRFDWQFCSWTNKNIIPSSDNFVGANWSTAGGSTTLIPDTPETTAPDGSYTAAKLSETSVNNNHILNRSPNIVAFIPGKVYTLSYYVKQGNRDFISLSPDGGVRTWFNIAGGTVATANSLHTAAIANVGNGWYRCSVTFTSVTNSLNPNLYINTADGQATYTGDPTKYMYIWGAQFEEGPLSSYMANTSSKNLLVSSEDFYIYWTALSANIKASLVQSSEDFSLSNWTKTGGSVTGSPGANVFTATVGSSQHMIASAGFQSYSGTEYTSSVRVKKGTGANAQSIIQLSGSGSNFPNSFANFNVTTGAIENSFNCTPSIISVGNGVYDLIMTATSNLTSGAAGLTISFTGNSIVNGRAPSHVAVANSDVILYKAQVVPGNVNEAFANSTTATAQYAYAPIFYPSPDGGNNALKLIGTGVSSNTHGIFQRPATTSTVPHTFSVYAKADEYHTLMLGVGSDATNPVGHSATYNLISGTLIANGVYANTTEINSVGDGWYRCSVKANTGTTVTRGTILTGPRSSLNVSAGLNSNSIFNTFTPNGSDGIRIWGAQLEQANANTTYEATNQIYPYYALLKTMPVCNGLFQEEARTNELLWCRDGTQSAWTKTNATVALTETGIDGRVNTATRFTATGANATIIQQITRGHGWWASGIYVKRLTGTGVVQISMDGLIWTDFSIDENWTRVYLSSITSNPACGIRIVTSGDELALDFAQIEIPPVGASSGIMTTPIYTETVAATRAVETVLLSNTAYSSAFSTGQGTIYIEFVQNPTMQYFYGHYATITNLGNIGNQTIGYNNNPASINFSNAVVSAAMPQLSKPGTYKMAMSWGDEGRTLRAYCGTRATTSSEAQGNGTFRGGYTIRFGQTTNNAFNSCIKRFVFIPFGITTLALREMVKKGE